MGKTDKHIIPIYKKFIREHLEKKIGMFGFVPEDKICKFVPKKDCYDLRLKNWDMNKNKWGIQKRYSTIVCLRTSGFAKDPMHLLSSLHELLDDGGSLVIDWSLGSDHYPRDDQSWTWGWNNSGNRCYGTYRNKKCYLYSSCITDSAIKSTQFKILSKRIKHIDKYSNMNTCKDWKNSIRHEFDNCLLEEENICTKFSINQEIVWTPIKLNGRRQLYIIHELVKV